MTLREQLLWELRQHNENAQLAIEKLKSEIETEQFVMSADKSAVSGATGVVHQNNISNAQMKIDAIKKQNAWIAEMLSQYK